MPQIYTLCGDVHKITSLFGRLAFVAKLSDDLRHEIPAQADDHDIIDNDSVRELVALHRALLTQWLHSSLEDRIQDLQVYFDPQVDRSAKLAGAISDWHGPFRFLLPAAVTTSVECLFTSDMRLLTMILQGSLNRDASDGRGSEKLGDWRVRVLKARAAPYGVSARATLKTLGGDLRVSARHLGRVFRRDTGIAFHSYLKSVRLAKAADLLRSPTISIKEIAAIVGYTTGSNFTRDFTTIAGISPKRYRDTFIDVTKGPELLN